MKNILITGASKGIGRAIAEELKKYYNVYATARNQSELESLDVAGYCVCDLKNRVDLQKLVEFIAINDIDILINNAGEYIYSPIEETDFEQIDSMFQTNVYAPIYLISKVTKKMKHKKWGRIVNIGSISGVMGEAFASLYSSSKSALVGLSKALALELAQYSTKKVC